MTCNNSITGKIFFVMMLTDRLKNETYHEHVEVEKSIMPFIKNLNSVQGYAHLLHIFYGYFSPVEELIQQNIGTGHIPDWNERRKTAALLKDAATLNSNLLAGDTCTTLPAINSVGSALGALYVLEGSTLGGVHIAAMISQRIPQAEGALTFFRSYGTETTRMWDVFKKRLNESVSTKDVAVAAHAANETFLHLKNWMEFFFNESEPS